MRNMVFKFVGKQQGIHYHARVFAGPDRDHLAFCGNLRMRTDEFEAFRHLIEDGTRARAHVDTVIFEIEHERVASE